MWPQNLRYLSRIRSAWEKGQRPTAALLEEPDPNSGWTSFDWRLQEAMSIMKLEICKKCGNPVYLCHSADNRIDFEIVVQSCYATAELEEYEENPANAKLEAGQYRLAKAVGIEGEDKVREKLPSRAEAMLQM